MATKKEKTKVENESSKRPKKLVVEEVVEEVKEESVSEEKSAKKENVEEKESSEKKEEIVKESESKDETEKEEKKEHEKSEDISTKKVLLIAIPIAVFTGLLSGGIFYYVNSNKGEESSKATSTPIPIVEETSSPEPTPTLERSDLKIEILNGSGTSGVAGTAKDLLEGLGYEDIDTGNADSYDFEETVISIKEESEEYLDMIVKDLSEEYTVSENTETLDEGSDFDIVITVGKS